MKTEQQTPEDKLREAVFEISRNWDCIKTFDELVLEAKFVFVYDKSNPMIVLKSL